MIITCVYLSLSIYIYIYMCLYTYPSHFRSTQTYPTQYLSILRLLSLSLYIYIYIYIYINYACASRRCRALSCRLHTLQSIRWCCVSADSFSVLERWLRGPTPQRPVGRAFMLSGIATWGSAVVGHTVGGWLAGSSGKCSCLCEVSATPARPSSACCNVSSTARAWTPARASLPASPVGPHSPRAPLRRHRPPRRALGRVLGLLHQLAQAPPPDQGEQLRQGRRWLPRRQSGCFSFPQGIECSSTTTRWTTSGTSVYF